MMKRILLPFLLLNLAFAENLPTLDGYKNDDRRPAPNELFTGKEVGYDALSKEVDEALKKIDKKYRKKMRDYLERENLTEIKEILEWVRTRLFFVNSSYWAIPSFFFVKNNTITCSDIKILDAAQQFENGGITLILKFKLPYRIRSVTPDTFMNRDMRVAFAVFTQNDNEVAFHNGQELGSDEIFFEGNGVYTGLWEISLEKPIEIINDIRCADREFKQSFLTKSGSYDLIE